MRLPSLSLFRQKHKGAMNKLRLLCRIRHATLFARFHGLTTPPKKLKCIIAKLKFELILLYQISLNLVIPARKRVSSAMDGKLNSIHGAWIPAIHAGKTILENSDHVI
jgi:hypothetical protein